MGRKIVSAGAFASVLFGLAGAASGAPVVWKNQGAMQRAETMAPAEVLRQAASDGARVVLTLGETPTAGERERLAASGVTLLAPLGGSSYFARIDGSADVAALSARVTDASRIRPEHKIHSRFLNDAELPAHAVLATVRSDLASVSSDNPVVGAYVVMHADVDAASPEMDALVAAHDGVVRDTVQSVNGLVVEMPLDRLRRLAADDRVQWVEPPLPRMGTYNDSNRARVQADAAQAAPYGLDGSGVTVFVYDGGYARSTHTDFSGRLTVIDSSGQANHATHVAGTIGGDGSVVLNNRGMAPGVTMISSGFEYDGSGTFLYTNPGDAENDYAAAISMGADISNNSIGSNVAPNGFPCSYEGDYGVMAATIDNMVRGSVGGPITIFWAAGNERGYGCGNDYFTSPPPGNNKNAITVGALNSNNDSMTSFSSWGPSDDGRIRPVIAAPGCQSGGDGGVTSTGSSSNTAYTTMCGTSMASPTAAGVGALVLGDFRSMFPSWGDPSNQLMKVFMIMGAEDIMNPGPDCQVGYGSIRAVDSVDFVRTGNWDEESVDHGGAVTFTTNVSASDPELKITVAWDDPAGTPNVLPALVNDLDLVVIDPNGVRHYPWTINPADPGAPAVRTREDRLNNIEQVFVDNPAPGTWQIEVRGASVPQGPQSFAIGSTTQLGEGYLAIGLLTETPGLQLPGTPLAVEAVAIGLLTETPGLQLPGTPLAVEAVAFEGIDSLVPGSVTLHYRTTDGPFTSVPMSDNGSGGFAGVVPGASCAGLMDFFITAEGDLAGLVSLPPAGADGPFHADIGAFDTVFVEDFQTDTGWAVSGNVGSAAAGRWERAIPAGDGSRGDPADDYDGSGFCYVTGNGGPGSNTDVDDGSTVLTSPALDASGAGDAFITYARWYSNTAGASPNADVFTVEISNNNGASWSVVEVVGPGGAGTGGGWIPQTIRVADYVAPSSQVRLRFTAEDAGAGSVIEAGVDAIDITYFVCEDTGCPADLAEPFGTLNIFDIQAFIGLYNGQDPSADLAAPFGQFNIFDLQAYIGLFNQGCP